MLAWPKPAQRWSAAQDRQQENSIPPLWSWLSQGSLNFNRSFDACIFGHNSKDTVMVVFVYFFGSVVTVAAVMPWILCVECGNSIRIGLLDFSSFLFEWPICSSKIHQNLLFWQNNIFSLIFGRCIDCGLHSGPITVIHVENAIMRPQRWISSNWLANKHWNGWRTIVRKITTRWDIWGQIELDRNTRGVHNALRHIITAFCVVFIKGSRVDRRTEAGTWRQLLQRAGVLALPVSPQVHLPLEPLITEPASERLVARVLAHVRDQVAALRERLRTHDALVRLLSWKRSNLVLDWFGRVCLKSTWKYSSQGPTHSRNLSRKIPTCVNIGVFLHVWLLVEPFATEWARVGPGVWVDEQVGGQSAAPLEGLSTLGTLEEALLPGASVGLWRGAEWASRSNLWTELRGGQGRWGAAGETSNLHQRLRNDVGITRSRDPFQKWCHIIFIEKCRLYMKDQQEHFR